MPARQRQAGPRPAMVRGAGWAASGTAPQPEHATTARPDLGGLLLQLHRSHGNHFVQRLVAGTGSGPAAARLVVGAAHDPAEAAADRVADAIADGWPAGSALELAVPAGGPRIQRRAPAGDLGGPLDGETSHAVGAAQRAGGVPLGLATRSRMEAALGTDLSGVRVHADTTARDLCDTVRASAFTAGQHVFFRRGLPDLGSTAGRHLLAHELAHVTQQSPPTVIRRTYLDSDRDTWIAATTRRGRRRSAALSDVDAAVERAREAYRSGYLPNLDRDLKTLGIMINKWRETRPEGRKRTRGAAVDRLDEEAKELAKKIKSWQGTGFRAQLTKHKQQLDTVEGWLAEGSRSRADLRLRNSVEWVRQGKTKLYVVTQTADSDYRANVLRWRGLTTAEGVAYFPGLDPDHSAVGMGTAESHTYDRRDAADLNVIVHRKKANGWNGRGYIVVNEAGTHNSDEFFVTLRHEVQHDADKHRGDELSENVRTAGIPGQRQLHGTRDEREFQKALQRYKTEYRAYSYQGEQTWKSIEGPATVGGVEWPKEQLEIFRHISAEYPAVGAAVGGDRPTAQQKRFIREARYYDHPDSEGFNKYNSVRIDNLYLALREVPKGTYEVTHDAVAAVLRAAQNLDKDDAAYIRAGHGPGQEQDPEQAIMLIDMINERLAGAARVAFKYELERIIDRFAPPPPRKKSEF